MDLFAPGPYLQWQVVYQKNLSNLVVFNQGRSKYGYLTSRFMLIEWEKKLQCKQSIHLDQPAKWQYYVTCFFHQNG